MRKRIPTLLALLLLIALIGFGIFLKYYQNYRYNTQKEVLAPQNLQTTNITDSSVSIIWQSTTPTIGSVLIENKKVTDDRDDPQKPQPRLTHFVTLTGLTPDTSIKYQIQNDTFRYPESPLQLKTISSSLSEKQSSTPSLSPIRGTIVSENHAPIDEAIITINFKNMSPKSTFVTTAGNFILPLSHLSNTALTDTFLIPDKAIATLEIRRSTQVSLVQVTLPIKDQSLPPITIGKNDNLTDFLALPQPTPQPLEFQIKATNFDLNNDGKVNTLDSSLVSDLINKKQYNNFADFNNDKVIDEKDLELIKDQLK